MERERENSRIMKRSTFAGVSSELEVKSNEIRSAGTAPEAFPGDFVAGPGLLVLLVPPPFKQWIVVFPTKSSTTAANSAKLRSAGRTCRELNWLEEVCGHTFWMCCLVSANSFNSDLTWACLEAKESCSSCYCCTKQKTWIKRELTVSGVTSPTARKYEKKMKQ